MAEFKLNSKLAEDTIFIKDLKLSKLLLMNDKNYPWFILVPRRNCISEIYELSKSDQLILNEEIALYAKLIKEKFNADKINIGALGNIVSQLHIHIIARYKTDISWPNPIWGREEAIKYQADKIEEIKALFS